MMSKATTGTLQRAEEEEATAASHHIADASSVAASTIFSSSSLSPLWLRFEQALHAKGKQFDQLDAEGEWVEMLKMLKFEDPFERAELLKIIKERKGKQTTDTDICLHSSMRVCSCLRVHGLLRYRR